VIVMTDDTTPSFIRANRGADPLGLHRQLRWIEVIRLLGAAVEPHRLKL
jgi:hypothetical protein